MAGSQFEGLGQTIAGGLGTAFTLGLNEDVVKWTVDGAKKVSDNTKDTWGADGDVTQFLEAIPGMCSLVRLISGQWNFPSGRKFFCLQQKISLCN